MPNFQSHVIPPAGGNFDGSMPIGIENRVTYRYAALASTFPATPTDVITIQGSATKTVKIRSIKLGGLATTAGALPVLLIRRSTLGTGGTGAAQTAGKVDTNDPAATAVVTLYSVLMSPLGTAVATLCVGRVFFPLVSTVHPLQYTIEFGTRMNKPLILRGVSDWLAINFNGTAIPAGAALDWEIETEEDNS